MTKKNFINRLLQHTQNPNGFWGRMMLRGMNRGHAPLATWGMSHITWQTDWQVLDIGCGGGANIAEMLRRCPEGMVYGVDISAESRSFSREKNRKELGRRCFINEGRADSLPFPDAKFDLVTAFETVYFWGDLAIAFRETARVLKPGGLFLICNEMADPSDTFWTKRIDGMVMHSAEEMEKTLLDNGFAQVELFLRKKNICLIAHKQLISNKKQDNIGLVNVSQKL